MRVDRGRLNWGIFFLVLGAVPLAYHQGAVTVLGDAWQLWPLVLVGIGLAFILSRTPAYFLGGTVVAVTMGLVFGSVLAAGPNIGCGGNGNNPYSVTQSGSFAGNSSVEVDLQCGTVDVTRSSDAQWHVLATNSGGSAAQVSSTSSSLHVGSLTPSGWSITRAKDDWQIALPSNAQLDLSSSIDMGDAHFSLGSVNLSSARFTLNLGTLHVDLTGATVGNLSVSTNLGSAFVTLDGASDLTGDLSTNLGSLDVCVPQGLGVQVTSSESLSSSDYGGGGLVQVGAVWQTPDYSTAAHRANLTIGTSLGSVKLHPAGGCK
jgi:hypothetical protein